MNYFTYRKKQDNEVSCHAQKISLIFPSAIYGETSVILDSNSNAELINRSHDGIAKKMVKQ